MSCPICGNSGPTSVGHRYDDRYGYPGEYKLLQCSHCRHLFLEAAFDADQLQAMYTDYYPRSHLDIDGYRPARERHGFFAWLEGARSATFRWVPPNVRVLDVGCGFGESLGYHRQRGCEVYGVEVDENIRRVAERYGFDVHIGLFDASLYPREYFDYVTMSQVIEHVNDPVQTLQAISSILKPGGNAVFSTPNARGWGAWLFRRYWINWHTPYHLHFFSRQSMRQVAEQAGLIVETDITVTSSAWLGYQWLHLLTFPKPGEPSIFWSPGYRWSVWQRLVRFTLKSGHWLKLNHLLTRLFDALGLGDNRIIVLRKP